MITLYASDLASPLCPASPSLSSPQRELGFEDETWKIPQEILDLRARLIKALEEKSDEKKQEYIKIQEQALYVMFVLSRLTRDFSTKTNALNRFLNLEK